MLCCNALQAAPAIEPGAYEVTASIEMPHLEENLRYATTHGVLEVKMGGKNMTFAQRVQAVRRGPCDAGMKAQE